MDRYCRGDVLRIFSIREQQLRLWERNGLIVCADSYGFQDLVQLRKLRDLGARRIPAGSIRDAVHAMRAVSGLPDPLLEACLDFRGVVRSTRRIVFRHSGAIVEPIAGQYLLDFSRADKRAVAAITAPSPLALKRETEREITRLFSLAVQAEESGRPQAALDAYASVLAIAPHHAASAINLGTIYYGRRDYARAEQYYRMAAENDPSYALAFFDLGNVLDELKRLPEAIAAYRKALSLQPKYADAHYNLALALERNGQRRSALRHWTAYLELDRAGAWAQHARAQVRKTLAVIGMELYQGTGKSPRIRPELSTINLRLV